MKRAEAILIRRMIEKAAEGLSDADALQCAALTEAWEPDRVYALGKRLQYDGRLWRVRQPELTSSELYPPGDPGTEALYEEVAAPGDGEGPDRPIAYNNNMELVQGKYYAQDGVVYVCTRSSGQAMTHPLAQLVGLYVEVVH